jgi:hypothetical protein
LVEILNTWAGLSSHCKTDYRNTTPEQATFAQSFLNRKIIELLELISSRINLLNYKASNNVFRIPANGSMIIQFIGTGATVTMTVNSRAALINSGNVLVSGAHYEFAYNILKDDLVSFDVQPFRLFELLFSGG